MRKIVTDFVRNSHWSEQNVATGAPDPMHQLSVYPQCCGQTIRGFGGAFTEAAGWCLQQLDDNRQQEVLEAYFGENGLGYTIGRTHINSCDFSLGNYACGQKPEDTFQMQRDYQYILPMIQKAQMVSGKKIPLLLSPWSPPAFMKSNGQMNGGGKLLPQYRTLWAEWMARYVQGYEEAGCSVSMISVQNEPAAVQTWDSCIYSGEEEGIFATSFLRPALNQVGARHVGILVWDHNKELLVRRACTSMGIPGAESAIAGFGFHWYSGDHFEALDCTKKLFPEKELWFTEGCVEYSRFGDSNGVEKARMYAHDMLGNLAHGTSAYLDWNLILDRNGGPNHVNNFCEASIMLNADGGYVKNASYYAIGHFSRYIKPGAIKLGSSVYSNQLEQVVFQNPDGKKVAVILSHSKEPLPLWVTEDGIAGWSLTVAAETLITLVW